MDRDTALYRSPRDMKSVAIGSGIPRGMNRILSGVSTDDGAAIDCGPSVFGAVVEFDANTEIYSIDAPADHIYRVVSGCVRTCKILDDGRRYIDSFYLRGDIFGFENRSSHQLSCEAICSTRVQVASRKLLTARLHGVQAGEFDLLSLTAKEMQHAQIQGSLLVRTASERVVGFLLQMSERSAEAGTFQLPMSRQDIADHLGLTIETVSRVLTQLEDCQIILRTPRRHIVVRNRKALERMST